MPARRRHRQVNDPRAEAMANMSTSKLGFAIFGKMFNIATVVDVDMSNPNPPNFDPEKGGGGVGVHPGHDMATYEPLETGGLFNADGDPICMHDIIFPTRAPGHCSLERPGADNPDEQTHRCCRRGHVDRDVVGFHAVHR